MFAKIHSKLFYELGKSYNYINRVSGYTFHKNWTNDQPFPVATLLQTTAMLWCTLEL